MKSKASSPHQNFKPEDPAAAAGKPQEPGAKAPGKNRGSTAKSSAKTDVQTSQPQKATRPTAFEIALLAEIYRLGEKIPVPNASRKVSSDATVVERALQLWELANQLVTTRHELRELSTTLFDSTKHEWDAKIEAFKKMRGNSQSPQGAADLTLLEMFLQGKLEEFPGFSLREVLEKLFPGDADNPQKRMEKLQQLIRFFEENGRPLGGFKSWIEGPHFRRNCCPRHVTLSDGPYVSPPPPPLDFTTVQRAYDDPQKPPLSFAVVRSLVEAKHAHLSSKRRLAGTKGAATKKASTVKTEVEGGSGKMAQTQRNRTARPPGG